MVIIQRVSADESNVMRQPAQLTRRVVLDAASEAEVRNGGGAEVAGPREHHVLELRVTREEGLGVRQRSQLLGV